MRWSLINYPSVLALLVKTDTTIGTGFSGVKEGFLLKVQIPENGVTTAPKKR